MLPFAGRVADSQLANLVRLMEGLFEARSVHLSRIASDITAEAMKLSVVTQLTRFLENGRVKVRQVYEPVARELLRQAAAAGRVVLIIDSTKMGFAAQLVMVSLAYRGRALPLIWTWLEYPKGYSLTATQVELLSALRDWLPPQAQMALVGDSEYGRCWLQEELNFWGWQYALRQSSRNAVWRKQDTGFVSLDHIELRGQGVQWFPHTLLTEENVLPTHLLGWSGYPPVVGDEPHRSRRSLDLVSLAHGNRRNVWGYERQWLRLGNDPSAPHRQTQSADPRRQFALCPSGRSWCRTYKARTRS